MTLNTKFPLFFFFLAASLGGILSVKRVHTVYYNATLIFALILCRVEGYGIFVATSSMTAIN
jgi:hypothetical protein